MSIVSKKSIIIVSLVFIIVTALFFGTAFSKGEMGKSFTGRVEVTEIDINSKVPGKIAEMRVKEGDSVSAGQILAVLENDELKAKQEQALAVLQAAKEQVIQAKIACGLTVAQSSAVVNKARAGVDMASAQSLKAKNGARSQEIIAAQAVTNKADSAYLLAKKTCARVNSLYNEGAIAQQEVDKAETALKVAEDDWKTAQQQLSIVKEGARSEDKLSAQAQVRLAEASLSEAQAGEKQVDVRLAALQAAQAQVKQAHGALDEVRAYLKSTVIKAPIAGTVTLINAVQGEMVSSGMPLLTVSNLKEAWVEVKIPETEVIKLKLGGAAKVQITGTENKPLNGKIIRISALPDFASKRATTEAGEKDVVSFGVKVQIKNEDMSIKPGMTAIVSLK